jgi:DNA (cytosine-5)-methyltransferase 1
MDIGLSQAGIHVQQSLELDKRRCETIAANFDHDVVNENVEHVTVFDQPESDVIAGTWPCQRYSSMADISGTRTGDHLFLHFLRHIVLARPEVYVVENVPGMKKFKVVMEALSKLPGYYVHVMCPVDTRWWLPQRRDRLILIGSKKPMKVTPPDWTPSSVKDVLEDDPEVHIPDYVQTRLDGNYRDKPIVVDVDGYAPTCLAHYAKDRSTRLVDDGKRVRPFSVREWARLQGFPDDYVFTGGERHTYAAIGDAVPVPLARWLGDQVVRYFQ